MKTSALFLGMFLTPLAVIAISCSGDLGPAGPQGLEGPEGMEGATGVGTRRVFFREYVDDGAGAYAWIQLPTEYGHISNSQASIDAMPLIACYAESAQISFIYHTEDCDISEGLGGILIEHRDPDLRLIGKQFRVVVIQ